MAEGGFVYVGLGGGPNGDLIDWWIYDIAHDSWTQGPNVPGEHRHHPYQFGIDGKIYVAFGHGPDIYNDIYRYDPQTTDWTAMRVLPAEGRVAGTQFAYNGKGYVLSGDGDDHLSMETGEFWEYDPNTNIWTALPPHPSASRWAPASFVLDDHVYIIGGMSLTIGGNYEYVKEVYKYDLNTTSSVGSVASGENDHIKISSNPVVDQFYWMFESEHREPYQAFILDQPGRVILQGVVANDMISTNDWASGYYYLLVHGDGYIKTVEFYKN